MPTETSRPEIASSPPAPRNDKVVARKALPAVEHFGQNTPLKRPERQPAEIGARAYVLLASDDGSYMSGAMILVTAAPDAVAGLKQVAQHSN